MSKCCFTRRIGYVGSWIFLCETFPNWGFVYLKLFLGHPFSSLTNLNFPVAVPSGKVVGSFFDDLGMDKIGAAHVTQMRFCEKKPFRSYASSFYLKYIMPKKNGTWWETKDNTGMSEFCISCKDGEDICSEGSTKADQRPLAYIEGRLYFWTLLCFCQSPRLDNMSQTITDIQIFLSFTSLMKTNLLQLDWPLILQHI